MKIIKQIVNIMCFFAIFGFNICKAEVRVAIIVPKTGEYKVWGDELLFGAQTAVNEINKKGGIIGKKLLLDIIDDTCSDNLSISTAQMLSVSSSIKPSLVIGPYCSNSFNAIAKIYSKAKILQIVPTTLNYHDSALTHKGVMKLVTFKEQSGKDFFAHYNKKYAGTRTAVVYDGNIEDTKEAVVAVSDEFRKHGKSSLLKQYNFSDYADLDKLASDINSDNVGIVYLLGNSKKNGKLVRDLTSLDADKKFFMPKYNATDAFFENASKHLKNVFFMDLPSFDKNPDFTQNIVNLRLQGIDFEGLNIYGYAAVKMWFDLVDDAKTLSYDILANRISKGKVSNIWKDAFFDNTSVVKPIHYMFYQYTNGEFVPLE